MLTFKPPGMMTSPGFWPAVQAPSHLASSVMFIAAPRKASLREVTVIV